MNEDQIYAVTRCSLLDSFRAAGVDPCGSRRGDGGPARGLGQRETAMLLVGDCLFPGIPTRRLRLLRLRRLLLLSCRFDTNHRLGHCIWQTCKFEGYFNVCSLHQIAIIVVHSGTVYHTILYCFIAHYSNNDCWLDKRNLFEKSIERQPPAARNPWSKG